jgi:hypothetical protein
MFQPDHRRRLDARTDALEFTWDVGRACAGSVGSPVRGAVGGAFSGGIGRTIRVTGTVRIGRTD